jgi:hypothetical protein
MADPTRKFESETLGLAGPQPIRSKDEARDTDGAGSRKARRTEGRDRAQTKLIVLRLIEHFEQDRSVLAEA